MAAGEEQKGWDVDMEEKSRVHEDERDAIVRERDEAIARSMDFLLAREDLLKENDRMHREIVDLRMEVKRMFSVEEVQEKIEEARMDRENEMMEEMRAAGSGNAVITTATVEKLRMELAEERSQGERLRADLKEEMELKLALKHEVDALRVEVGPAVGEYKSLLLRHEDLWRKHRELLTSYQILQAAHDKEATAHKVKIYPALET
ncbi:hypothetical protein HK101_002253 [Irineochytrium annulatum]|nr:hypothetical protein HK101_002253 [Irineochytrium annulatum]